MLYLYFSTNLYINYKPTFNQPLIFSPIQTPKWIKVETYFFNS